MRLKLHLLGPEITDQHNTCEQKLAANQWWEERFSGGFQWVPPIQIHVMGRSCTPQIHHTHIHLGDRHDTFHEVFEDCTLLWRRCYTVVCPVPDLVHELYRKSVSVVHRWMVRLKRDHDVLALFWGNAALYWRHTEHAHPAVILGSFGTQRAKFHYVSIEFTPTFKGLMNWFILEFSLNQQQQNNHKTLILLHDRGYSMLVSTWSKLQWDSLLLL